MADSVAPPEPERHDSTTGPESGSVDRSMDDIVIVGVIVIGFLLAPAGYLALGLPPTLVGVLTGSAVAALVYRFLGGIDHETTFMIGAFKITGTLAALIAVLTLVRASLDEDRTNRRCVEGTFVGLSEQNPDLDPSRPFLIHSFEPASREMNLYTKKEPKENDGFDLGWSVVAEKKIDEIGFNFIQRYGIPSKQGIKDPDLSRLPGATDSLEGYLALDLKSYSRYLDRILTIEYLEASKDRFRSLGEFVLNVGGEKFPLPLEEKHVKVAGLIGDDRSESINMPWRLLSGVAWAEPMRSSSPFDSLGDPTSRKLVLSLLGSNDFGRQIVAREKLATLGPEAQKFVRESLSYSLPDGIIPAQTYQNLAWILESQADDGTDVPEDLFRNLGRKLYEVGAYASALRVFDRIPDRGDPILYLRRGISYYQLGEFDAAAREFQRSAEGALDDDLKFFALRNLGHTFVKLGDRESALDSFEAALDLEPRDSSVLEEVERLQEVLVQRPVPEEMTVQTDNPAKEIVPGSRNASTFWVLVGRWGSSNGFEQVHFRVSEPPRAEDVILSTEAVNKRLDVPRPGNDWQQGDAVGVLLPGSRLRVIEVWRSGTENEHVWARVVPSVE